MQTYERETGPRVWLRSSIGLTGVVFEDGLPEGEDIAQHLSTAFGPVLFVHSYEGALWGYKLFLNGVPADEFCTRADYFEPLTGPLSHEERLRKSGNANLLASILALMSAVFRITFANGTKT